jgi:hypothetical protein
MQRKLTCASGLIEGASKNTVDELALTALAADKMLVF